ncbi:hypothetical protein AGMMS50212_17150 [Spirochaetia bacterium]|nr:hypothetical protein AGMMS50212_17150 [Spirochaetia bacterium]
MKNLVRLWIFFSFFFTICFAIAVAVGFLGVWVNAVSGIPVISTLELKNVIQDVQWAFPLVLYVTIIFSVSYASRSKTPSIAAFISIILLSVTFSYGVSKGLSNARYMIAPPLELSNKTLGKAGLMLTRGDTVITMLDNPKNERGSRVVSIPDRPLIYQEVPLGADGKIIHAPNVPFSNPDKSFFRGLFVDLNLSAIHFASCFNDGLTTFLFWNLSLVLLLCSLGFLFQIGTWPLANIFLNILIFRSILYFEVFLNSKEIQDYLLAFTHGVIITKYISPVVVGLMGILFLIYLILYFLARGNRSNANA